MSQQLLDLFNHSYEFSGFIAAGNELIVAGLQDFANQFTHLYGGHLSGKSHLLKAWVNLANQRTHEAIYIDAVDSGVELLQMLQGMEYRFVAIDNIDQLDAIGQIRLFDLFNYIRLSDNGIYLLTSACDNLNNSGFREDLKTRIYSGVVLNLKPLTDEQLMNALRVYTKREGLKFGEPELAYLLKHHTRNLGQLIAFIDKVGKAALINKKNITIPLIKACMI